MSNSLVQHSTQIGGPEGITNLPNRNAADSLINYYEIQNWGNFKPNYLPLPPCIYNVGSNQYHKLDFNEQIDTNEVLKRTLYFQKIESYKNVKNALNVNIPEYLINGENDEILLQTTTARTLPLLAIQQFVNAPFLVNGIVANEETKYKCAYPDQNVRNAIFENSRKRLYIIAGLGTGGGSLFKNLSMADPSASFIILDPGILDVDNIGNQEGNYNQLGSSKLAIHTTEIQQKRPISSWESNSLFGPIIGINAPYTNELNQTLESLILKRSEALNLEIQDLQILGIDEIDVTEGEMLVNKIKYHKWLNDLANTIQTTIPVTGGLDIGYTGLNQRNNIYFSGTQPLNGIINTDEANLDRIKNLPPFLTLALLFGNENLTQDYEILVQQYMKTGKLKSPAQSVYSGGISSINVGASILIMGLYLQQGMNGQELLNMSKPSLTVNLYQNSFTNSIKNTNLISQIQQIAKLKGIQ